MKVDLKDFSKLLVRPTVVISTISPTGISNAAPFSFNSPVATRPKPLFGFESNVNQESGMVGAYGKVESDSQYRGLRYWVEEMHVDGFRFDLASILSRDESGHPLASPPILWDIETAPVLAGTKLIAEAWDAAGLYQVGSLIGDCWKE